MEEIYPKYYEQFRCIAGRCEDTCCAGWEIDIDDDSYEKYMRVDGALGEKLRCSIRSYGGEGAPERGSQSEEETYANYGFILTEDKRCPFLQEDNLCELYCDLGESVLCEVCQNTPRNYLEYGGRREISISASCPEAARLIYGSSSPMEFSGREVTEADTKDEIPEDEQELAAFLIRVRDAAIRILQDRSLSLEKRIDRFLAHAETVQKVINDWETGVESLKPPEVPEADPGAFSRNDGEESRCDSFRLRAQRSASTAFSRNDREVYRRFLTRMSLYSGLAAIGPAWAGRITMLYDYFVGEFPEEPDADPEYPSGQSDAGGRPVAAPCEHQYRSAIRGLMTLMEEQGRLYEYEHLLVYYAFLLLNRSIDDYDYLTKAKLVVMSYEFNRDMDAGIFFRKGDFLKNDREENARIYAREVEHAEENLADLTEELLFM